MELTQPTTKNDSAVEVVDSFTQSEKKLFQKIFEPSEDRLERYFDISRVKIS